MKAKILGIILAILGITSLILALVYINGVASTKYVYLLLACGIAGTILFFTGIGLIPNKNPYEGAIHE